jgi:hypothetical protein
MERQMFVSKLIGVQTNKIKDVEADEEEEGEDDDSED